MPSKPSSLTLIHHELRYGTVSNVPRHLTHPLGDAIAQALEASHHCRRTCAIEGAPYEIFSDLAQSPAGNACYFIVAGKPSANGRIEAGATLYTGVVAYLLPTAPTAFRHIMRTYIPVVASAPRTLTFAAPGPMPHKLPWTAGYFSVESTNLTREEKDLLLTVARLAALKLVATCEQATTKAIHAGQEFYLDFVEYPELRPPEAP